VKQQIRKRGKRNAVVFLGLNAADQLASAKAFQKRYRWTWPSIRDPKRALARKFGATYQPAFILIDAKGRFVSGFQAAGTRGRWNALIKRLP
jgi:cytochrome c biogenesis protein CcmG, thiol:disulfide interchange protein DsbE